MQDKLDALMERMRNLEQEMMQELRRKEAEFLYEVRAGRVRFTGEAKAGHRKLSKRLRRYLLDSSVAVILTTPVMWACLVPIMFLDLIITIYQALCFPISTYLLFHRRRLADLNVLEKLNCELCAYGNGVLSHTTEVAARTEQNWCPIKHALRMKSMNNRYHISWSTGTRNTTGGRWKSSADRSRMFRPEAVF